MGPDRVDSIPVTVVHGVLGAGKTTLVNHLLRNNAGKRLAVIVNDVGEVNIDADLIERENPDTGVVDLSNGCICCRLQGDLVEQAAELAETREFDHLVVESSGVSEPIPIARALTDGTDQSEIDPTDYFRLDTTVTVLDTYGFWQEFGTDASIPVEPGDRPLAELFVEAVEFCDVLVLNKCDLVPDAVLDDVETVLDTLQPRAKRIRTTYGEVDPDEILATGRFDFATARRAAGWKAKLRDRGHDDHDRGETDRTHAHDESETGFTSFVYRRDRPFDPARFADWLEAAPTRDDGVVRMKGLCWVAGYDDEVIGVSRAGPSVQAGPIGGWGAETDGRTELVFIGFELEADEITGALDACLRDEAAGGAVDDRFPLRVAPGDPPSA
ncbi:CobW family GTP-binding protein [Haloferacaceae archaeon DSL9]